MDDSSLFERAMRDVRRLEGPSRRVSKSPKRASSRRRPAPAAARFDVERFAGHVEGWAKNGGEAALRRLRSGEISVERRVDLHGLTAPDARQLVREVLASAVKAGQRCLLIVHGRGRGSAGGAVLKEALPGWLAEAPHGRRVLAFSTATPNGGAGGATSVLLRRPTGRRRDGSRS